MILQVEEAPAEIRTRNPVLVGFSFETVLAKSFGMSKRPQ